MKCIIPSMLAESDELLAKLRVWLFKMKMILFAADKGICTYIGA